MANVLKIKLNEAENRIISGQKPQDVFDTVTLDFSLNDPDERYACFRIAQKIRYTIALKTRKKIQKYRILLMLLLICSAIIVFFNNPNRFEVFSFFTFNSIPSFVFFIYNNIFLWIYLFCAIALLRWKMRYVWATIYFTIIDFVRVLILFPDQYSINSLMAILRLSIVLITFILSVYIVFKSQNRYKTDKINHVFTFTS